MKPLFLAATIIAFAGLTGEALAVCSGGGRVNAVADLNTLLSGNTVCVPAVTTNPMTWQELHVAGGNLVDYKRGPGHPVDPSETVGSWSVAGNSGGQQAEVTHNYGNGGSYTYSVFNNGNGTHSFCSANPEIVAKVKTGGGAC